MATANLFIDWSAPFHDPPWQACNDLPIESNSTTVEDLMNEASNCSPSVTYEYEGEGSSAYVTSIDGVSSNQGGNGYYWVYFVNGQMPSVGFGAYTLENGDSVAWDYKHFSSGLRQANDTSHPSSTR